jgi:hypothetical protein
MLYINTYQYSIKYLELTRGNNANEIRLQYSTNRKNPPISTYNIVKII